MTGIEALMYYVLFMVVILLVNVGHRIPLVLLGKKPGNFWTRGNETGESGVIVRAGHAHANCVENLPLFAAVVLAAAATGQAAVVDGCAAWVLYARIAQSVVHLIGTSTPLVLARATFFLVQVILVVYMAYGVISGATGG